MTRDTPLARIEVVVLVAIGGFAGSNLRFFTGGVLPGLSATLAVNAAGSLLLGFVLYESMYGNELADETRLVLSTGFLSSFTTYSTFALESALATPAMLAANVLANYALGLVGVLVGRSLARSVGGRSG